MPDVFVTLPTGEKIDAGSLTVNGQTVIRERDRIAGAGPADLLAVVLSEPLPGVDSAAAVRLLNVTNPIRDVLFGTSLAPGATIDLDATVIPSGKIGRLMSAVLSSSVAARWDLKSRAGASLVTIAVLMTSGISGQPMVIFASPSKHHDTLSGNGTDTNFRVTVTNLDLLNSAGVYATLYSDET